MKKIKTLIHGGLGNQLFQYAAGKSLKKRYPDYKIEFVLNDSLWSDHSVNLDYYLNILKLNIIDQNKLVSRIYNKFFNRLSSCVIKDTFSTVNLNEIPEKKSYTLDGYFQNSSWYLPVLNDVCEEIISKSKAKIFDKFQDSELVIALRRSDYTKLGWELNMNYYYEALNILNKNKEKKITLISEDEQFVGLFYDRLKSIGFLIDPKKNNFSLPRSIFDFATLIKSKNLIMANSSFSWWAASIRSKLGYNNNSVIIPKNWYPEKIPELKSSHPGNPFEWLEIDNNFI